MLKTSAFAETAALVGDPARAGMLAALMDGRALTASELATCAGVTPQTASGHLARLTEAGILAMERQGRHRYHRLASPTIAHMLESIMTVAADRDAAAPAPKARLSVGPRDKALRRARTCYDHLAGEIAVGIADRMQEQGGIELSPDGGVLTADGADFLRRLGVDLDAAAARSGRRGGRMFCRPCLDWSERRPHIAGAVGAALCQGCFAKGWLRRIDGTRALAVTPLGETALRETFDLRFEG
jgi:DNA-binding transcriptional ArsR family regulator